MKCFDCIEKGVHPPNDAEVYMIQEYESVRPLCGECLDAYIEMEGEINVDYHSVKITGVGQEVFIQHINEVLKYLNEMNKRFSDRYFAAKKLSEHPDHGDFISVDKLKDAIEW